MPKSKKRFSEYLPKVGYNGSFLFEPVLIEEIELEISNVDTNKQSIWILLLPNKLTKVL